MFTAGNVQRPGDFLEDDALPFSSGQRDDVLPAVVGDYESGKFLQSPVGFLDISEIEMGDPAGERYGGMAGDKTLLFPRIQQACHLIDFFRVMLRERTRPQQMQQQVMRGIIRWFEESIGRVAHVAFGIGRL